MGATSKKAIERRKKARRTIVIISLCFAFLLAGFVAYIYWTRFQVVFEKQAQVNKLEQEIARLKNENRELSEVLNKRNDLQYIEKLAREKLGYVMPKE